MNKYTSFCVPIIISHVAERYLTFANYRVCFYNLFNMDINRIVL